VRRSSRSLARRVSAVGRGATRRVARDRVARLHHDATLHRLIGSISNLREEKICNSVKRMPIDRRPLGCLGRRPLGERTVARAPRRHLRGERRGRRRAGEHVAGDLALGVHQHLARAVAEPDGDEAIA